jgi:DNA (cytosine-5)-methyltransferase 1
VKVLDLFSGIGGFSLGLEAAGMETVAFCEIEPFCRAVLKKHWSDVPCHEDVTKLDGKQYAGKIDVVCGGFPCQDISTAGKGAGLAGARSGLFYEALRIVKEARPDWVILENVSALRSRGLEDVLRAFTEIGYDAEWHCIPASAVGAHHRRDRVWIVAYAKSKRYERGEPNNQVCAKRAVEGGREPERLRLSESCDTGAIRDSLAHTPSTKQQGNNGGELCKFSGEIPDDRRKNLRQENGQTGSNIARSISEALANANCSGCLREGSTQPEERKCNFVASGRSKEICNATGEGFPDRAGGEVGQPEPVTQFERPDGREVEYDFCGIPHGVSNRVDRLKSLGNSVVPQIPFIIGQAIMQAEGEVI